MTEARYIERHRSTEDADSFADLRRLGIELAQRFSGKLWTDYNLHDPGVTILEQLAYALTELIYRADLPVADLLRGKEGIDYRQQALIAPEEIFPSRPSSPLDYRKILLNAVSELDDCRLQPLSAAPDGSVADGLYRLLLKLSPGVAPSELGVIEEKVRACYLQQRNLAEDLAEILFMQENDYALRARVEVASALNPADILAEIYFDCARRISGRVRIEDFPQSAEQDIALDRLFTGPFTDKGLLQLDERFGRQEAFLVSTLYSVINGVDGVDRVETLCLQRDGRDYYDTVAAEDADATLQLRIPHSAEEVHVVLTLNGRALPVAFDDLRARYDELRLRDYASRSSAQDLSLLYELPAGTARPLDEYFSIQNQFPATYGIGRYGVPDSAAPQVKARVRQLRGYLVLFEQIMANYLANLNGIKQLYSIDKDQRSSYAFTPLDDSHIRDLRQLFTEPQDPHCWDKALGPIVQGYDHYHERKGRLLDYLLALYGESFSQNSLRHFDHYYQGRAMADRIVDNKIDYLMSIVEVGRDRAKGANYRGRDWRERASSGLHRRVGLLLGFTHNQAGSLVRGLLREGLKLARHKTYEHLKAGTPELRFIDPAEGELLPVAVRPEAATLSRDELRSLVGDGMPFTNRLLSDLLLCEGIDPGRFHMIRRAGAAEVHLCFRLDADRYWWLGDYADADAGTRAANALQQLLIRWNLACEGFHLVEHILLRPLSGAVHEGPDPGTEADFFSHRVSVLFPGWTARCRDADFRLLAEETVRLNLPAHLYAEIHWLGFHEMYEWEEGYANWLELKAGESGDPAVLDRASAGLRRLLLALRTKQERGISP